MNTLIILSVVGARPNFMKIAPFARAIENHNHNAKPGAVAIEHFLMHTGQHYDKRMSEIFYEALKSHRSLLTDYRSLETDVLLHQENEGDMEWLVRTAYRMGLQERHILLQPAMLTASEFDLLAARERRFALDVLSEGIAA